MASATPPVRVPVLIDGSFGEGGGQIIRNAITLACILRRQIKISSIRANRPNPGLASQHLESILALQRLCGATTDVELRKGLTEFDLHGEKAVQTEDEPNPKGIDTTIDLVTAGSVSLCVQVLLPYLFTLQAPARLRIIGGTHTLKAPSFDYLERVFIPMLGKRIGYGFDIRLNRPGYFPRGGGSIQLEVRKPLGPGLHFKHFNLLERGKLLRQTAVLNVAHKLSRSQPAFLNAIRGSKMDIPVNEIEVRSVPYAALEYFIEFENSCTGFYYLAEGRNPTQDDLVEGIKRVGEDYATFMKSTAAVDEFMQDQLIIYMALAKLSDPGGSSTIRAGPLTDHTTSAIHVVQLMTGLQFQIQEDDGGATSVISI